MAHPLLRLAPLFRPSLGLLLGGVAGLLVATGLNLAGPLIVAMAIDDDLAAGDVPGLVGKGLLYLGILVVNLGLTWGAKVTIEVVAQRAMLALKTQLFDHLIEHDLAFHDTHASGRLITRVQGDTEALRVLFSEVILVAPADIALFTGMFAVILTRAPDLAPLVFAVLPPYVLMFAIFRMVSPRRFMAVREVKAKLTGFLSEHLRAMPVLQLFGRVPWANRRADALNAEVFRKETIAHLLPVGYFNGVFLVRSLGMVLVLWIGAGRVSAGVLTVGALVMGLGYLRQMFNPLMRLSHHLSTLERARAAAIRIAAILDRPRLITDPQTPVPWPGLSDALRLQDVRFHYFEGTPILRGVDLTIPAGQHVGIVGATGAGKTTVLNLLLRFRDPTGGKVTVDGVDLRDVTLSELRSRIGLVLQDVHLFAGTVLANLGGEPEAATRALQTLGVQIDLHKELIDGGLNLSRGERQLLTFARALAPNPDILVLDEATSAVDPETEQLVQGALGRLMTGRTTITVAHRLTTVRDCDRIYVLGAGLVVESGTHDELIAARGLYAALHELQHGAAA